MKTLHFLALLLLCASVDYSQSSTDYSNDRVYYIIIAEHRLFDEIQKFNSEFEKDNWIIAEFSFDEIDSINNYLSAINVVNKQRVHLITVGKLTEATFINHIFTSTHELKNLIEYKEKAFSLFLTVQGQYKWTIDIIQSKQKLYKDIKTNSYRQYGVSLGWFIPDFENTEGHVPKSILNYSLHYNRKNSERVSWNLNMDLGIKIPNPKNEMGSIIQSQIDPQEILSSGEDSIEIDLNTTLGGHVYGSLGVDVNYHLKKGESPFYIGGGLNFSLLNSFSFEIDTSFVLDVSDFKPGNQQALQPSTDGLLDSNPRENRDGVNLILAMQLPITMGANIKLNDNLIFTPELRYFLDLQTFNPTNINANGYQFKCKLAYRFYKKVQPVIKFYELIEN